MGGGSAGGGKGRIGMGEWGKRSTNFFITPRPKQGGAVWGLVLALLLEEGGLGFKEGEGVGLGFEEREG